MVYVDLEDLARTSTSDKVLRDKAGNAAKYPKYDKHQCGLASTVCKFFNKKVFWCCY